MESADSTQRIAAGAWGQRHGRPAPSFWCRVLSSLPPSSGKQQFLLLHADAAKFRAEHPLCYGVPLRSRGGQKNAAAAAAVVAGQPERGKVAVGQPRRPQRQQGGLAWRTITASGPVGTDDMAAVRPDPAATAATATTAATTLPSRASSIGPGPLRRPARVRRGCVVMAMRRGRQLLATAPQSYLTRPWCAQACFLERGGVAGRSSPQLEGAGGADLPGSAAVVSLMGA